MHVSFFQSSTSNNHETHTISAFYKIFHHTTLCSLRFHAHIYHFTDRTNLSSIKRHGGLYSWADCNSKNINIPKPGGGDLSHRLDIRHNLQNYVRLSFVKEHPMMYVAKKEGRISDPVILEIDPSVIWIKGTQFSDRNATDNYANIGYGYNDLDLIHFDLFDKNYFSLDEDEKKYYQAEVLVRTCVPIEYILNL